MAYLDRENKIVQLDSAKIFLHIDLPYLSFWLVIGQISVYVWRISSLEREKEREIIDTKKIPCIFKRHFKMGLLPIKRFL